MSDFRQIELSHVHHEFPSVERTDRTLLHVVDDVSFDVSRGQLVAIVGPSGSGKTTLLRAMAGLLIPTRGDLRVNGKPVTGPGPDRILLFQELHLFHWQTAQDNVRFALQARGVPGSEMGVKVSNLFEFVGLSGFENYYPNEISGGMKQRLALARALAAEPEVLLLDEPFGSLDLDTRHHLEAEYLRIQRRHHITTVMVTHDLRQAVFMADRIIVLSERPCRVLADVSVPFEHPRADGLRLTRAFHDLEDDLARILMTGKEKTL